LTEEKEYTSYSESGGDVDLGDECSRLAYEASQRTFTNQKIEVVAPERMEGGFSGPLRINSSLEDGSFVKNSDGVGSKALVAQRMKKFNTLGYDLIAMLADDTASTGALPVAGTNTLDLASSDPDLVDELMSGLVAACEVANVSMVGGEIAELPDQVKGYSRPFIWNGDLLGLLGEGRRIDGSGIVPGHNIVGLRGNGIRSNGLTLARKICRSSFGPDWHEETFDERRSWGEVLLSPSRIYAPIMVALTGGFQDESRANITGIVHVTGGGMANLNRVLPEETGAILTDLFPPQEEFIKLQELGPVAEEEAYRTWNMGQPVLLVTPEPEKVENLLEEFEVPSRVVGEVTNRPEIVCRGKGLKEREFVL